MSMRSGRVRASGVESSPPKVRKLASPSRSPARRRKASPHTRSVPRKSPARKSPGRKPISKFPARKSPSRATKETTIIASEKTSLKRGSIKNDSVKEDAKVLRVQTTRVKDIDLKEIEASLGERFNGFEPIDDSYVLKSRKFENIQPRRSTRIRDYIENVDIRSSFSKSSKSISKSVTLSDGENSEEELYSRKSTSISRKLATPLRESINKITFSRWEFGGRFGAPIFIFLLPVVAFFVINSSSLSSFKNAFELKQYRLISTYFNTDSLTLVLSQGIMQALLACIPFLGTRSARLDGTNRTHCFNAFFASIVTLQLLFTLEHLEIVKSGIILKLFSQLTATSYCFAITISLLAFVFCRDNDNSYGDSGYYLYDFWMGRQLHAAVSKLDIKIWLYRISNVTTLVLAVLLFKHGIEITPVTENSSNSFQEIFGRLKFNISSLTITLIQLIYILRYIIWEHKVTTTFFWQYEGIGYYQIVASFIYPYYFMSISKTVLDNNIVLSTNVLLGIGVLFTFGYLILHLSNNIKHELRTNILLPGLAHLETMPTFHGKKLLLSGLWGFVRHPNYLGDILIHISLAIPGIVSGYYISSAPAILTIITLLHRACRDHFRCQRRYGAAWQRYCKRVPSVILPKIL